MSFTVIIPARLASTRLPNKPIADICGKPMIVRVAEQALKSGASRVICAVDDELILKACEANGIEGRRDGGYCRPGKILLHAEGSWIGSAPDCSSGPLRLFQESF